MLLVVVLTLSAIALGTVWSLYRAYPYEQRATVESNAALYGQDPLFIAAIIRTESGCNPEAVSAAGAVGLLQVMPDTGKWIAQKNKWEYSDALLRDEGYNIKLGCWYVDYLTKRFDGDPVLALAAYNAGESPVRKWVGEGRFRDGRRDIPFAETNSFVRKVMNAYEWYQRLYQNR